jgi:release factor glutamine methyltransferase
MRLIAVPGVFRPRSDSRMLAAVAAQRVRPETTVLDPFTGSGILAVAAARAGAREVSAIDVSRRAVACAWLNGRLNGVRVRALRGDLFSPVKEERFDLIVANPPYLPGEEDSKPGGAARAWEGGADGRALLDRLCDEAAAHLTPGGELVLVQSSICGLETTLARLEQAGLRGEVLLRERGPLGPLLASRAEQLERRGLLARGQREEEIQVIRALRAPA